MAETMAQARRMVNAAEAAGKIYAVTQSRRPNPGLRTVQRALGSGVIGNIHTINADFYIGAHFGGFREEMEHVLLLDMAIHSFDQARSLSGLDPVAVYCREYNPPGSWYRHGASAMAIFEMEGGALFNYRGSWCAEGANTSWECTWRIVGDRGTLLWDGEDRISAFTADPGEGLLWPVRELKIEPVVLPQEKRGHAGVFGDFIRALREGTRPETDCRDNIKSLAMVFASIESARTGARVTVDSSI
jgi:predicted dehydrogenase